MKKKKKKKKRKRMEDSFARNSNDSSRRVKESNRGNDASFQSVGRFVPRALFCEVRTKEGKGGCFQKERTREEVWESSTSCAKENE